MNVFEQAIESGEIRIGEISKPMLTPQKWAAFLLCDEHEDDAYVYARQQIRNNCLTLRCVHIGEMERRLLTAEAFQRTMAAQRRYRDANSFVCAILRYARQMVLGGTEKIPVATHYENEPNPPGLDILLGKHSDNDTQDGQDPDDRGLYGSPGWTGGAA